MRAYTCPNGDEKSMRSRASSCVHAKLAAAPSGPRRADNLPSSAKGSSAVETAGCASCGTVAHADRTTVAQASATEVNFDGRVTVKRPASHRRHTHFV